MPELLEPRIAPATIAAVQLKDLTSDVGLQFTGIDHAGEKNGEFAGLSVHGAGDVNGDGYDDIVIGAPSLGVESGTGAFYVVYGSAAGITTPYDLSTLDGTNGFRISGLNANAMLGRSVTAADVNGDGKSDLILGAPKAAEGGRDAGAAYVIFGSASFGATFDLKSLNGTNGFEYEGGAFQAAGYNVAAGDLNHDGYADVIVSVPQSNFVSAAAIIFGKATPFSATMTGSDLTGANGFRFFADVSALTQLGPFAAGSLLAAGDVNGDGIDDLIVGSPHSTGAPSGSLRGAAYVLFGKTSGFAAIEDFSTLNGTNGFALSGVQNGDYAGTAVATADLNKDGFSDLIIGAPGAAEGGHARGAVYVIFGKASGWAATASLGSIDAAGGFKFIGRESYDAVGYTMSASGDVNHDGVPDLIIGNERDRMAGSLNGAAYVVFGSTSGFAAHLQADALNGTNGFVVLGANEGDSFGRDVSAAGDFNHDGIKDVIIGAPAFGARDQGAGYVIFGGAATSSLVVPDVPTAKISADGKTATYVDVDGDRVTVKTTKGAFTQIDFELFAKGKGAQLQTFSVEGQPEFANASITFSVARVPGGDGRVNVGAFNAYQVPLSTVRVPGDVALLRAGETTPKVNPFDTPGIKTLSLGSLHALGESTRDLRADQFADGLQTVFGGIGKMIVAGDMDDSSVTTQRNGIGSLLVKGNVSNVSFSLQASTTTNVHILGHADDLSLDLTGGALGSFIVGKSFTSTGKSFVATNKTIGTFSVGGVLSSSDPAKPLVISALGNNAPNTAAEAQAIRSVVIGGDVTNVDILAGYDGANYPANGAASIGAVLAKRNWTASSIVAGVKDTSTAGDTASAPDGFGQNDTLLANSTKFAATIASITIRGAAAGTATAGDSFGFTAAKIGSFKVGAKAFHLSAALDDFLLNPAGTADLSLAELPPPLP